MKIKTSELTGAALDWAVAQCEGEGFCISRPDLLEAGIVSPPPYSTDWAQGGPIIERERLDIQSKFKSAGYAHQQGFWYWQASTVNEDDVAHWMDGLSPLIAAMRCYVASKLGDEVDIPEELLK